MTEQQKRRKVGRPRLDFKKKYTQVRVNDDLADEMKIGRASCRERV